ncbi:MAG TPA: hypothetical protein DHV16_09030 [Nitrospiraceae bacterium]|nr:MAG: hypothetical protein A2Z82_01715 [Nitrospirae bacterium GWA2_46_11]OGW25452.1 MAG: hypothetical protein A2X55_12480 [Nitrospirae bacterium GWB2_47_37]HAK87905.1 hypothetical protein [Nitrospiraceae bacterium]HCZ12372.1 hypothetical protein [Nitrospiraceae bacterium]
MGKETKQVKSFSTDAKVYEWLVQKIKESGSDISISELINDYLGYLYYEVKSVLDYYEKAKIKIDQAWVINKIINDSKFFPPKLGILYGDPDMKRWMETEIKSKAMDILEEYQKEQKLVVENIRGKKKLMDMFRRTKD